MSDSKSNVSKMPEKKDRIPLGSMRLIGYGYLVVCVFFAVFFLFLAEARKVSPSLDTPRWSLLLAGILVLPLFLPALKYVAPYIKSIKISDVEVSFVQAEVTSYSLTTLTAQLKAPTDQSQRTGIRPNDGGQLFQIHYRNTPRGKAHTG